MAERPSEIDADWIRRFRERAIGGLLREAKDMINACTRILGEIGGHVDHDGVVHIDTPLRQGTSVPPTGISCLVAWHVHPYARVLNSPREDVPFHPPSTPDVYYAIFGRAYGLYELIAICTFEGLYVISTRNINPVLCRGISQTGAHDPEDIAGTADRMPFDAAALSTADPDAFAVLQHMLADERPDVRALAEFLFDYENTVDHATRTSMTTLDAVDLVEQMLAANGFGLQLVPLPPRPAGEREPQDKD